MNPVVDQSVSLLDLADSTAFEFANRGGQAVTGRGSRLVDNSEAALPRAITQLDVLPVEGGEQGIEPPHLAELLPVEHCGTAACEDREERLGPGGRFPSIALMNPNESARKATDLSGAALFTAGRIKNAAVCGKDRWVIEVFNQRRDCVIADFHIIVDQEDQRLSCRCEAAVTRLSESPVHVISNELERDLTLRSGARRLSTRSFRLLKVATRRLSEAVLDQPVRSVVGAAVVHDEDFDLCARGFTVMASSGEH